MKFDAIFFSCMDFYFQLERKVEKPKEKLGDEMEKKLINIEDKMEKKMINR